jgi:hypothetical protein
MLGSLKIMNFVSIPEEVTEQAGQSLTAESMEKAAKDRVDQLIAKGDFSDSDITFIKSFALPAASGELKASSQMLEKLRRVAQVWDVELKQKEFSSHRPIIGKLIVAVKRALFPIIKFFLADTLRQQRDYNAAVLRCLVELTTKNVASDSSRLPES